MSLKRSMLSVVFSLVAVIVLPAVEGLAQYYFRAPAKAPSSFYVDLELFTMETGPPGFRGSSFIFLDWYTGGSVVWHAGVGGAYFGDAEYFQVEGGIGFVLSKNWRYENLRQVFISDSRQGSYIVRTTTVYGYYGGALTLGVLDLGVKLQMPYYMGYDSYDVKWDGIDTVFGQYISDLDEVYIWQKDKVFYIGYKELAIKQKMFTATESIWYLRALIGLTDRRAEYYLKSDSTKRMLYEADTIKFGAEFGIRWYMFQSSIGFYDSRFFFTIGYRLGFQIGI